MGIRYIEKKKIFQIDTENTTYLLWEKAERGREQLSVKNERGALYAFCQSTGKIVVSGLFSNRISDGRNWRL